MDHGDGLIEVKLIGRKMLYRSIKQYLFRGIRGGDVVLLDHTFRQGK